MIGFILTPLRYWAPEFTTPKDSTRGVDDESAIKIIIIFLVFVAYVATRVWINMKKSKK